MPPNQRQHLCTQPPQRPDNHTWAPPSGARVIVMSRPGADRRHGGFRELPDWWAGRRMEGDAHDHLGSAPLARGDDEGGGGAVERGQPLSRVAEADAFAPRPRSRPPGPARRPPPPRCSCRRRRARGSSGSRCARHRGRARCRARWRSPPAAAAPGAAPSPRARRSRSPPSPTSRSPKRTRMIFT